MRSSPEQKPNFAGSSRRGVRQKFVTPSRSTTNVRGNPSLPVLPPSPTNEEPCGQVDATLAAILVELGENWRAPLPPNPMPADEVEAWIEDARRMHEAACVVRLRRELRA